MNISVIVCTHDRCQSLAKTLQSLAASTMPDAMQWEILVVDNNSRDQTREMVGDFSRRHPGRVRYIFEPQQGKPHALNSGIREARGDVLAFVHDDATVEPSWLQNLTANLHKGKWVGAGGRVEMQWPASLPGWLSSGGPHPRHGLPGFDLGSEIERLPCPPPSTNMAFRKSMFDEYGMFRTETEPEQNHDLVPLSAEAEFGRRLNSAGKQLRYERSAVVYHPVADSKLSKEYLLAQAFNRGRADGREYSIPGSRISFSLAAWTFRWMTSVKPSVRFYRKLTVWEKAGTLVELRHKAREAKAANALKAEETKRYRETIKRDNQNLLNLKAGEWVEVRTQDEILATLDQNGRLGNVPFMPEMLEYCGKQFRVHRRTDKTCDNIEPWSIRRMVNTVLLEGIRCDGSGHGGCQAGCMIFWKEAWLKRAYKNIVSANSLQPQGTANHGSLCTLANIFDVSSHQDSRGETVYSCQATEVLTFSTYMASWDPRQYVRDLRSGNLNTRLAEDSSSGRALEVVLGILRILRSIVFSLYNTIQEKRPRRPIYPFLGGTAGKTPLELLNLQPGDLVQVRSKEEIIATLDRNDRNRGLLFDGAMLTHCGAIYRVLRRVHRIIDEKSGKMMEMKNPCIALEGVTCRWDYHRLCPRDTCTPYWREGWLRRAVDLPAPRPEQTQENCEKSYGECAS